MTSAVVALGRQAFQNIWQWTPAGLATLWWQIRLARTVKQAEDPRLP